VHSRNKKLMSILYFADIPIYRLHENKYYKERDESSIHSRYQARAKA
jgi:hypothetical protein